MYVYCMYVCMYVASCKGGRVVRAKLCSLAGLTIGFRLGLGLPNVVMALQLPQSGSPPGRPPREAWWRGASTLDSDTKCELLIPSQLQNICIL